MIDIIANIVSVSFCMGNFRLLIFEYCFVKHDENVLPVYIVC